MHNIIDTRPLCFGRSAHDSNYNNYRGAVIKFRFAASCIRVITRPLTGCSLLSITTHSRHKVRFMNARGYQVIKVGQGSSLGIYPTEQSFSKVLLKPHPIIMHQPKETRLCNRLIVSRVPILFGQCQMFSRVPTRTPAVAF